MSCVSAFVPAQHPSLFCGAAGIQCALPRRVMVPPNFRTRRKHGRLYQERRSSEMFRNDTTILMEETSFVTNAVLDQETVADLFADNDNVVSTTGMKPQHELLDDKKETLFQMPAESILWLNAVAIVWGSQHAVIKLVVQDCDASAFSLARFGLAALLAAPYTPKLFHLFDKKKETVVYDDKIMNGKPWEPSQENAVTTTMSEHDSIDSAAVWRWGAEMGMWMFLGYAFQAIGLEFTTAQRSGFLLYLNVKFVPFFARILLGREISIPTWVSAATALVGTAALLVGGEGTSLQQGLNVGDAWSVAAAAASAMFILRLESASKAVPQSAQLNAACLWVVMGLALVWSLGMSGNIGQTWDSVRDTVASHPWELVYLGGVTTALANYLQTRAQKGVSAERASVIYAMDPVYGAAFSNLLLGEELRGWGIVGAGLITMAAATNAFLDFGQKEEEEVAAE